MNLKDTVSGEGKIYCMISCCFNEEEGERGRVKGERRGRKEQRVDHHVVVVRRM